MGKLRRNHTYMSFAVIPVGRIYNNVPVYNTTAAFHKGESIFIIIIFPLTYLISSCIRIEK